MNDLSIALNGSTLSFGQEKIDLFNCTLDNLTDVFGEPDTVVSYPLDERYQIFIFSYYDNVVKAFVKSKDPKMFFCTSCIEQSSIVEGGAEEDKGILAELHIDLDEFFPLNMFIEPLAIIDDPEGQIAIFSQQFAACLFNKDTVNKLIFVNPQIISIRKALFFTLHVGETTTELHRLDKRMELRLELDAMRQRKKLSYPDIEKMAEEIIRKIKEPTKK